MPSFLSRHLLPFVGLALLVASGCSSEIRQDKNYGTDIGKGYMGPEGGLPDASQDVGVSGDAFTDARQDAEVHLDAQPKDTSDTADATMGMGNAVTTQSKSVYTR